MRMGELPNSAVVASSLHRRNVDRGATGEAKQVGGLKTRYRRTRTVDKVQKVPILVANVHKGHIKQKQMRG